MLSWNHRINATTKKENYTTAFLRRNLTTCPRNIKLQTYKSLVRPQLEYAGVVWDNSTKKNINAVKKVQRRAARYIMNDYSQTSSVTYMLEELQHYRNGEQDLMFRIVNNLVDIQSVHILHPSGSSTRDHLTRFLPSFCRSFQLPSPSGMDYHNIL